MRPESTTIDAAVGNYLRAFREAHGLSLEQVANAARRSGATWGAASVRSIERGEASLTLDKLIHIGLAIRHLSNESVALKDLLGAGEWFRISDEELSPLLSRSWLIGVLSGDQIDASLTREMRVMPPRYLQSGARSGRKLGHLSRGGVPPKTTVEESMWVAPTAAEDRAAKKLGPMVSGASVALWAQHLWGHSLDDEARHRAGENASPQARGRVTRILTEEIRTAMIEHSEDELVGSRSDNG